MENLISVIAFKDEKNYFARVKRVFYELNK
jgi:hypothetical protein